MIIVLVVTTCIYGGIHSKDIRLDKRTAVIHKELSCEAEQSEKPKENDQKMTVAVVSDLHLAYNTGLKEVRSVVKYINEMDADLVCMPGDFFTNVYDDVREPEAIISELRKIKSRYGVFGCWGNHDVDEPILAGFTFSAFMEGEPVHDPEMVSFLKKANIKMLEDEYVLIVCNSDEDPAVEDELLHTLLGKPLSREELVSIDEAVGSRIHEKSRTYNLFISRDKNRNYRMQNP